MTNTFNELVDAFEKYQRISNRTTLRTLTQKDIDVIRSERHKGVSFEMPKASSEDLDRYQEAEAALIKALNNYVDVRIEERMKKLIGQSKEI